MNNWLRRGILFFIVGIGGILSWQYITGHFKSDRQIILLNTTRPDLNGLFDIEKRSISVLPRDAVKGYLDYFHLVTEVMPANSDGALMLGYLDEITGNETQAVVFLKKADQLDPQFFFIEYDLALICFKQGDYAQSAGLLQRALAIAPQLTLKQMMHSIVYRQIFSSMKDSNDIIAGLRQAYQDAEVLLMESLAKQKQYQGADVGPEVHAHIM